MENTSKNKYCFFALYWDFKAHKIAGNPHLYEVGRNGLFVSEFDYLELKPLSSITDEDANKLGDIWGMNSDEYVRKMIGCSRIDYIKRKIESGIQLAGITLSVAENMIGFLRSKGYALPFMGLSVEEMIEYGWIKPK